MIVLDENVPESQRQLLRGWRIRARQIGMETGRLGMSDDEILKLLHRLKGCTFITRDLGFYQKDRCHPGYCLVCLATGREEAASFIRRFLQHPAFKSRSGRMGLVVHVGQRGLRAWKFGAAQECSRSWPV